MATDTTRTIPATVSGDDSPSHPWALDRQPHHQDRAIADCLFALDGALFALSTVLVFVGTLAQVEQNMWEVLDGYFQTWFAWIDFRVLLPISFFPNRPEISGGFWLPGGYLLGLLLGLNLLAAHAVRFTVQARGTRLWVGLGVVLIGTALTLLIILSGHRKDGLQGIPFSRGILSGQYSLDRGGRLAGIVAGRRADGSEPAFPPSGWQPACACYGVLSVMLLQYGSAIRPSDPSMRILWQLIQGQLAALVLLAGFIMVFKRRGAIVLIHAGVALLMLGQLLASMTAVEEQIALSPGEETNFARETRKLEIAVVDRSDPEFDQVVAVPGNLVAGR